MQAVRKEFAVTAHPSEAGLPPPIAARLREALDKIDGPDWQSVVIARLTSMVMESNRQLSRARAEGRMGRGEASRLREHVAALESALEAKRGEWEIAEGQLAAAQSRRERRRADDEGWADARAALLSQRVEGLLGQLERAQKELVAVRVESAGAAQEAGRYKESAERLGRKLMVAEADLTAARDDEKGQAQGQEQGAGEGGEEIKAWFEEQVRVRVRQRKQAMAFLEVSYWSFARDVFGVMAQEDGLEHDLKDRRLFLLLL